VAWCCRQIQDVLHPAECQPATLRTSEWQWTGSVFTAWHCAGIVRGHLFRILSCRAEICVEE
jgi:hypothetical protein